MVVLNDILCYVGGFLCPGEINAVAEAARLSPRDHIAVLQASVVERYRLTPEEIDSVNAVTSLVDPGVEPGIFYKMFRSEALDHLIRSNELLDPRTKVQLLVGKSPQMYRWFIDTFVVASPMLSKSPIVAQIHDAIEGSPPYITLLDRYLLINVGPRGVRVYDKSTHQVVAFATGDTVYYLDARVLCIFESAANFSTLFSIYKVGEGHALSKLVGDT